MSGFINLKKEKKSSLTECTRRCLERWFGGCCQVCRNKRSETEVYSEYFWNQSFHIFMNEQYRYVRDLRSQLFPRDLSCCIAWRERVLQQQIFKGAWWTVPRVPLPLGPGLMSKTVFSTDWDHGTESVPTFQSEEVLSLFLATFWFFFFSFLLFSLSKGPC